MANAITGAVQSDFTGDFFLVVVMKSKKPRQDLAGLFCSCNEKLNLNRSPASGQDAHAGDNEQGG